MTALNLKLHAGGYVADLDQVMSVETPPATESFFPIGHGTLINLVTDHFAQTGMQVVNTVHGLAKEGARYFGLFQIENRDNPEYDVIIGLRNAHDHAFAAGLAVGSGVFICDNLAFSSEVKIARKHTRFIERDLPAMVAKGIAQITDHRVTQDQRIESYKNAGLSKKDAYSAVVEMLKVKAFPNVRVQDVVKEYDNPRYSEFTDENVWRLFNAVTTVCRPSMLESVARTRALHAICDKLSLFRRPSTIEGEFELAA